MLHQNFIGAIPMKTRKNPKKQTPRSYRAFTCHNQLQSIYFVQVIIIFNYVSTSVNVIQSRVQ